MRPAVTTVEPGARLAAAAYLMKRNRDSALVVTSDDQDRRPLGVLTDAEIAQAVADGRDLEQTRIRQVRRGTTISVEPGTSVASGIRTMLADRTSTSPDSWTVRPATACPACPAGEPTWKGGHDG